MLMAEYCMTAGALARGDAAILLRFPQKGYREKIWDHAAGVIIVQEAGAVITDASGTGNLIHFFFFRKLSYQKHACS